MTLVITHYSDTLGDTCNDIGNDTRNDTHDDTHMNLLVLSGRCRDDDPKFLTNPYKKPKSLLKNQRGAR